MITHRVHHHHLTSVIAIGLLLLSGCQALAAASNGTGSVAVATDNVHFGTVTIGDRATLPNALSNHTSSAVTITAIQGMDHGFQITGISLPIELAPGQSVPFDVQFQPTDAGHPVVAIAFAGQSSQPYVAMRASGVAVMPGKLSSNPSPVAFGSITVGTHHTKIANLLNYGGTDLVISQATLSGAGFSMINLALPLTLRPGQATPLKVTFAPTKTGGFSGGITFATASGDPVTGATNVVLSLSGDAISLTALTPGPSSLTFGRIPIGTASSRTETLTNAGGADVTISQATASGPGFSISGLALPLTLGAAQSTSFTVLFSPTAGGAANGSVNITGDSGNLNLSIPVVGSAHAPGSLSASPTSANFGRVTVGSNQTLPVTVANTGNDTVTLSSAAATGYGFKFKGQSPPITLTAGQSATFNVTFNPAVAGAASGALTLNSDATNETVSVPLAGMAIAPGQLGASPSSLSFGSVQIGGSKSLTSNLTNSGGGSLTITAAAASGSGFSLSGLALPVTLNAGQSTPFTVLFSPATSGAATGSVSLTSDGSNPSLSIPLAGTGLTAGALAANPTSLAFGSTQVGSSSSLSETLTNTGGTTVTISGAAASGTGFSLSGIALPVTLNAGQTTSFTVVFSPKTSGAASGSLNLTSDASNSSLSIPLTGTGLTAGSLTANPTSLAFGNVQVGNNSSLSETVTNTGGTSITISAAAASGPGFSLSGLALPMTLSAGQSAPLTVVFSPTASGAASGSVSITSNGANPSLSIPLTGTGQRAGSLTANPTSLAFGSIQVGNNSSLSETLTNTGGTSIIISAAAASGTGFSLSGLALPVTLNAGHSTSFTVVFSPTASGAASGNVSITSNGANPSLSIPLTGTGQSAGALSANPASLAFGSVQVSNSNNMSETLTNTGGSTITISQANVTGTGFSTSGLTLPVTLTASQSVTFTATFTPATAGAASATLSVVSNASNSPLNIALSGTGTATGMLAVSPTNLAFGNVAVGSNASLTGSISASGGSVSVTSASINNSEFVLSGISLPVTLAAGQSATFGVTFTPQSSGATSASLSFSSNASNSPTKQAMTGTGTAAIQHTVDLGWSAASNAMGYNVYRSTVSGGPYSMINTSLNGTTSYSDNTVVSGQTYYYVATTVDTSSNESEYSNQTKAVVPNP